jgi:cell division protein FtsQ
MDRSRRGERDAEAPSVPTSSRLTVRKTKNRRRPVSLWSRAPGPKQIVDGCGRALRRGLPAIIATSAVMVLGTGVWLGYRFVTTSDRFAIEHVEINGNARLSADQIRAAMPVQVGDNVFTADLGGATARLRAEPWIASADARRVLPDTIVVDVREHQPAIAVALPTEPHSGEVYLADARGRVFKRVAGDEAAGLPRLTGLTRAAYRQDPDGTARQIVAALDVLKAWNTPDRPAVSTIRIDNGGNLSLLADQATIELGQPGPELAPRLRTFDTVWSELSADERNRVRSIHLVNTRLDHVTVAFKD